MKRISKQIEGYITNIWKNEYKENTLEFTILGGTIGNEVVKLYGTWTYRGVIEDRVSFLDDEYFGNELIELADVYKKVLVPDLELAMKELLGIDDIY